ncbi:cupin domain-containing protein [Metabacillus iocasae]|uniref:Quercetin dioxygenase-like cupin family protein n=1 Tax=Priestia iocasae TaxID=2291674 RepID=A0ABS2QUE2_9BACI|nr:cupin domain-containing protein [Metabacillus iocasae]MBM7703101.1 quercetin dioxygenase-like cupin family protein [Metabacillus iocasae]
MKLFHFDQEEAQIMTQYNSNFKMTKLLAKTGDVHISCLYIDDGDYVGEHEATVPQLFLVVQGEGVVRGNEKSEMRIKAGEAAYWKAGELHAARSERGMMAIVIEGLDINPELFMKQIVHAS